MTIKIFPNHVFLIFLLFGLVVSSVSFKASPSTLESPLSASTVELVVEALFFNTTERQYVAGIRVSFYSGYGKIAEVTTVDSPLNISLEAGDYFVVAELNYSRVSEEIYIGGGFGRLSVFVDPSDNKLLYVDYTHLGGSKEHATVCVYARFFNSTNTAYVDGVHLIFIAMDLL
ncbi:MAG: hypothetical protein ACP6IP_06595 [Candidatus Njordarchaeia archaeon]